MLRGYCSYCVEFELFSDHSLPKGDRRGRLVRCLEQLNGVEEIVLSAAGRRVLVIFHQVLITADDIEETLVEAGHALRVVEAPTFPPISKRPFLH